jgi:hypothetical protein
MNFFRYHLKAIESVPVVTSDEEHLEIKLERIKCLACPDASEVILFIINFIVYLVLLIYLLSL